MKLCIRRIVRWPRFFKDCRATEEERYNSLSSRIFLHLPNTFP
jgi:hypothetical protein